MTAVKAARHRPYPDSQRSPGAAENAAVAAYTRWVGNLEGNPVWSRDCHPVPRHRVRTSGTEITDRRPAYACRIRSLASRFSLKLTKSTDNRGCLKPF